MQLINTGRHPGCGVNVGPGCACPTGNAAPPQFDFTRPIPGGIYDPHSVADLAANTAEDEADVRDMTLNITYPDPRAGSVHNQQAEVVAVEVDDETGERVLVTENAYGSSDRVREHARRMHSGISFR